MVNNSYLRKAERILFFVLVSIATLLTFGLPAAKAAFLFYTFFRGKETPASTAERHLGFRPRCRSFRIAELCPHVGSELFIPPLF